ncbi:uncharacterized protein J4E78_002124 [Alternaria triticimaculans]|uniref:uncharacterized protein n=1 Tax=Alternaria triticimaculans TaxID=297637 RepID=UPI0020C2091C|nr:uncharacterized protein J4E78_002124 [Alternaria triticimaculans]KAI4668300.1 hypothetical protein J4E78_002124 [Alternaria triticimaculans]
MLEGSSEPSFLEEINRSTHPNHTNVPVFARSNGPIWQQPPSPEVDAAWHALTSGYPFLITEDDMRILGKDPDRYISVPQSFGYGEKKFITRFAHPHNIHCLDHIRKRLYRDYYGYPNDTMDWIHTEHCLHALVDHLTCYVQYDVLNYMWVEGEPAAEPELTYNRQCQDLDALLRWSKDNRVDKDLRVYYIQPAAGDKIFPADAEFRNIENEYDQNNPDRPSMEDRRKTYQKAYQDAISYWKTTGEVPIEERPW